MFRHDLDPADTRSTLASKLSIFKLKLHCFIAKFYLVVYIK